MSTSVSAWELLANAASDRVCHLSAACGESAIAATSVEDLPEEAILRVEAVEQQPASDQAEALRPHRWAGTLPGTMAGKRPPAAPRTPIALGC